MTTLDHIQYNPQSVGIVAKACASNLGYSWLRDKIKGKDCDCQQENLKYVLRAQKVISCYHAPGSTTNSGVLNQSTILFAADTYGFVSASIVSSNGDLNSTVIGVYPSVEKAVEDLIVTYLDGTSYVATAYANNNGDTVFNIIAPASVYCGATYTITIGAKDIRHPNITNGGTFGGGQCIVTADDNCITVDQANQIIENINEICGGLCGCQDYFTDSQPIE